MENPVLAELESQGHLQRVGPDDIDHFVNRSGLGVLFFAGGGSHSRETHDVAVALRELIKDYAGHVRTALVEEEDALKPRFRVLTTPSLVFTVAGQVQEVLPGIRDWNDYRNAFQRYLGPPPLTSQEARA